MADRPQRNPRHEWPPRILKSWAYFKAGARADLWRCSNCDAVLPAGKSFITARFQGYPTSGYPTSAFLCLECAPLYVEELT